MVSGCESAELTPRQREALRLYALNRSMKEVARSMGVSEQTIKNTLHHAYERLEAQDSHDAYRALGWLVVPDR